MARILRVFPVRTNATPGDELVAVNRLPYFFDEADEIHISIAFTWHKERAEQLADEWRRVAPVEIGGPGWGSRGEEFVSGRYVREGCVITSRGCPNRCWFCSAWKRDGPIRELAICEGHNILDDNLLACSEDHICAVFEMLSRQKSQVRFTGGLEAARLQDWHVHLLAKLHPQPYVFFAYDTADDWEPLVVAADKMWAAGFHPRSHKVACYVLIGWPQDTIRAAQARLEAVLSLRLMPMAMLWRDKDGSMDVEWRRFQRSWARPAAIYARNRIPLAEIGEARP